MISGNIAFYSKYCTLKILIKMCIFINIIMILLSIEILILSINLNFATLSIYLDDFIGNLFVVFILTIAAAESAIGLSLITCLFKLKDFIELKPVKKRQNKI